MRRIFSSQRVETAEGVAELLRGAGIEVRLSNGRSYQSKRSGQFSYLEQGNAQNHPTVWIVHANDQPRAREILREARLLDSTRHDLPDAEYSFAALSPAGERPRANWAWRIRLALLAVIGLVAMFVVLHHRAAAPPAAPPQVTRPAAAPAQPARQDQQELRVRIDPAG
ncbi:MAG: hypothetical protein QM581_16100 [Pseudomonas sp.]